MQTTGFNNNDTKNKIKFPKIQTKARSLPGEKRFSYLLEDITAKAWIYCTPSAQYGYKTNMKREIASLTKIMTCICALQLCEKYKMNRQTTYFKVTEWASQTIGTTANLVENCWMSIQDLLYGMMLPSGNDAATTLAQNLGAVIYFDKSGNQSLIQGKLELIQLEIRSIDLTEDKQSVKFYMFEFVSYMNEKCQMLKMYKTRFSNSHGLDMLNNYSCCQDLLILTQQALKNDEFKKIVKAQTYKGLFKFFKEGKVVCKPVYWTNTNKLLERSNIIGVKTGITVKAGGCLSTSFTTATGEQGIIVVLGSASQEDRFRDTLKIMKWAEEENI